DNATDFDAAVREYHDKYVAPLAGSDAGTTGLEFFLNRFDPFFICQWLYVGVMVLACLSWLTWSKPLNNAATALALFALSVHTLGLVLRVIVSGKPPV